MDDAQFDAWTRRRFGLAAVGLGAALPVLAALRLPAVVGARKRGKKKRRAKKPRSNAYGCLDVGKACGGNDARCCSGVCEGNGPKKGKRDSSQCVGHGGGICLPDPCVVGEDTPCNPANFHCSCVTTTGKAGFCGDFSAGLQNLCWVCKRDTDCEAEFGVGAACAVFGGTCASFCPSTGGTACLPSCA